VVWAEAAPLVEAALDLVAAAADEGDQFPVLRAGIATGPTLPQSGDFYGRSVNLASRITGIARPGSVLVDTPTRESAGEDHFTYSFAGERRLKGIDARQKLFRVRSAAIGDGDDDDGAGADAATRSTSCGRRGCGCAAGGRRTRRRWRRSTPTPR
jgi:class 3 adenylate cyclase